MAVMYCWRSGVIKVGRVGVPDGALPISIGGEKKLRRIMWGCARKAYDNKTWLVPGVPEAGTETKARKALEYFTKAVNRCMGAYVIN